MEKGGFMAILAINGGKKAVTKQPKISCLFQRMLQEQESLIVELVRKREISFSPVVKELEEKFAAYTGTKYALTTNNGTAALHSAFFSVIKNPGDQVITSVHTWHLGVTPIICTGGVPVFCDIEPLTLNIDPSKIEEKITPKTVAICVTHVYGHPCDMDAINSVAKKHGLAVIEDASHSHGCEYKSKKTGSLGDIGCFSLQGSKLMSGGEAGIIVTDNHDYYQSCIMLGHYERMEKLSAKYDRYKANQEIPFMNLGYKYRIHPFAAAMALVELKYLDERNQLQIQNCSYIGRNLEKIEGFKGPFVAPYVTKLGWLNFLIRLEPEYFKGIPRTKIIDALRAEGIEAATGRPGYIPLVRQPLLNEIEHHPAYVIWYHFLNNHPEYKIDDYPVAEKVLFERIAIPSMRDIEYDQEYLQQICDAFRKISQHKDELK